ncbi:RES family NAD+ phosphorylase (plasmid) [Leifsonia sp. ZF2019]|uniref:RES domain-containing protein n=1 Tax=Leifsonia sp. ZF2019 TaxID=2781978 RepID=UPI001CBC9A98|nr:RES domain-containing protein [Leifsonia sp. ZF2019]UAJ81757.1 RES family NAD+ phosphorylase [Leifsonia sp. ZF2019]
MSPVALNVSGNPGRVWRVGFEPDMWAWTPWQFATDEGLFNGRWDDQLGQFRTLYTSDSLLGCFLELLSKLQPSSTVEAALDDFDDDDGSVGKHPEGGRGEVGLRWLEDRLFGDAEQYGRYCFITHSDSLAALKAGYRFDRHDIAPADVDSAMLKDARDRDLTRSIAHWIYDLRDADRNEFVDGIEFRSRHGDEIRMWAVFERADDAQGSRQIDPQGTPQRVAPDTVELLEAFDRLGLHWAEI